MTDKERVTGAGDFSIGSLVWPGISKLVEECGEVLQIAGKLIATRGEAAHWDGGNLVERLEEEMADVMAAICFVVDHNNLDRSLIQERCEAKYQQFREWQRQAGGAR
jgi:NTP pyrophosphatase (non-canonical NTP hydrolase)